MAGKKPVDPLKAKEARQKKIAIGGAVLLVIVLVIQVPKLMKQMGHSTAPPAQPAATVAAPTTPDASGSSTGTGSLLSASAPTAAIGQFSSFAQFGPSNGQVANRDPFSGPGAAPGGTTTSTTTTAPTTPKTPPTPPTPPSPPTTTPAQTYTSATISVNGVKETVQVGGNFPASAPFFHLVSVSAHSAKISIAGGSLANGAPTVTIEEGKPLTLMNTTDGTRYKISFLGPGSGSGGSAAGGSSTTGAATTAGSTTTTTTTGK